MASATSSQGDKRAAGTKKILWATIRDQLIKDIESGKYPAGSLLPSVRELTARMTISTTTARKALAEVVSAGYARPEGTRGHVSAGPRDETVVRAGPQGSATDTSASFDEKLDTLRILVERGYITPADIEDLRHKLVGRSEQNIPAFGDPALREAEVVVRVEPAPAEVALALQASPQETPVTIRRRLAVDEHGTPIQIQTSYTLRGIVEGTRLAESDAITIPWLDAIAQYAKVPVWRGKDHVTARHPTDAEAAALGLALSACVLVRVEIAVDKDQRPIDYTVTVWPGETTRLALGES
jgi:DNA-binding GntR family transcriptional regulator